MQMIALIGWLSGTAWAGPVEDNVEAALAAIQDGDIETAHSNIDTAREAASTASSVIDGSTLAKMEYYGGILEYYDGDRDNGSLERWRAALVFDPNFPWDTSLVVEEEPQSIFETLRMEINAKPTVDVGVPADAQGMVVYVDGLVYQPGGSVLSGQHLLQVICPDQSVNTSWSDFSTTPDYEATCPDAFIVAEPEPEGPSTLRLALWGGGGALLLGGTATNFLWVNPTWEEIDTARQAAVSINRSDADALTSEFRTAKFLTMGLLGAGAASVTVGFFVDDLTISPTGNGVLLSGRF